MNSIQSKMIKVQ